MKTESKHQRTGFQFEIYKLNISIVGAIIAFGITHPKWDSLLLTCLLVSGILFILWFHYDVSIADGSRNKMENRETPRSAIKRTRRYSFAAAMMANFILLPVAAVALFFVRSIPHALLTFGAVLIAMWVSLFVIWYRVQYHGLWLTTYEDANKPSETTLDRALQR